MLGTLENVFFKHQREREKKKEIGLSKVISGSWIGFNKGFKSGCWRETREKEREREEDFLERERLREREIKEKKKEERRKEKEGEVELVLSDLLVGC